MIFSANLRLDVTFSDPEEYEEAVPYWDLEQHQISSGRYLNRILAFHTSNLQIGIAQLSVGMFERGTIEPGTTMISLPADSNGPFYYCGRSLGENEIPALDSGDEYEILAHGSNTLLFIAVDCDLLEHQALNQTGQSFSNLIRGNRLIMPSQERVKRAARLTHILDQLLGRKSELSPVEQRVLENEVLEIIISGLCPRGKAFRLNPSLQAARRAHHYIHRNLQEEITIVDLRTAAGCSHRTLFHGFRERYGMSPHKYLQTLRLNEVRRELCHQPSYGKITEVAMKWGFFHLSRFTSQYRRLFGENPSDTVKSHGQALAGKEALHIAGQRSAMDRASVAVPLFPAP